MIKGKSVKKKFWDLKKKTGIKVMEVSAKSGDGIENAFKTIIEKLIMKK